MTAIRLLSIALSAAAISMAVSVLIVVSQRWHGRLTLDHGLQKFHTTAVPRIGSVAILGSILVTLFCSDHTFRLLSESHLRAASLLLVAGLPAFLGGRIEDVTKRISARMRCLPQLAAPSRSAGCPAQPSRHLAREDTRANAS